MKKTDTKLHTKLYTRKDIQEIFNNYAIAMRWYEAVPERDAIALFGKDAWNYVDGLVDNSPKEEMLVIEVVGDHVVAGLTLRGVWVAASYCNAVALIEEAYNED